MDQIETVPSAKRNPVRRWAADKTGLLLVLVAGATLAASAGRLHFLLELFTHFRPMYFLAAAALTVLSILLRSWRWALFGVVVLALNGATLLPYYRPPGPPAASVNLRILEANVLTENRRYERLLSQVQQYRPDVILLIEVDKEWLKALAKLSQDYPYTVREPRRDNFGMAVFSRFPILDMRTFQLAETEVPAVSARIAVDGRQVEFLGVHAYPPESERMAHARDRQLRGAADIARGTPSPIVVCGDFNATPWSPVFKDFLLQSGLRDARLGFGIQGTWPAQYAPLLIPLDQCLVSRDVSTKSFRALPSIGSDHLPLLVELSVPSLDTRKP